MRSLRHKIVLFILPLCLVPLVGISIFSYYIAKERITEDRIVLYIQQITKDIADTVQLTLLEKKEGTVSMTLFGEFRDFLSGRSGEPPVLLLNKLLIVHDVYDVIALFDIDGRLVAMNSLNRNSRPDLIESLDETVLDQIIGQNLVQYTPDNSNWLQQVRARRFGYVDWHRSPLVNRLHHYASEDIARQYSIGFAAPVLDERDVVIGGVLALMNWQFVQEILDKLEDDFEERSITTGYAFLFGNDHNTIIGHKYRRNRNYSSLSNIDSTELRNNYTTRLVEDHGLEDLHQAVVSGAPYHQYEYPPGTPKISGLAPVHHEFFQWVCGVGINDEEIFAPVQDLRTILLWTSSLSVVLVGLLGYTAARRVTTPLKKLTLGAREISAGNFSRRVEVFGRDEIGELATSFNEMAGSLEERSRELIELNRSLEIKVQERTQELEEKRQEVVQAYDSLKDAQFQLIQSEKMASLGQLVAGIAHEIKNPLNFIYGNTEFLRTYIERLERLVRLYDQSVPAEGETGRRIAELKQEIHYEFTLEDLRTLIANFEEGARRIHDIIGDLRSFSRMESDELQKADIHESIELALNLLQNEYRDRIEIRKEYATLPQLKCHPGKLSQVFMNLLSNACQAIPDTGVITIRTRRENDAAVVEISDNGVGMEAKDVDRIFEPFFTTKPVGMGTGLGLSISYAIVEQHQGVIEVESEQGRGATFRVRLPVNL